ncbi:MAG: hypothetical protein AAF146_15515 [Bacteroidota bacterium]
MNERRNQVRRWLWYTEASLLLGCLAIYGIDYWRGDGDGIIEQFRLNPVELLFWGQVFLLPLLGMTSRRESWVNGSLLLLTTILLLLVLERALRYLPGTHHSGNRLENQSGGALFSRYDTVYFKNYLPQRHFLTHVQEAGFEATIENRINSRGIRGPEIGPKPAGTKRTLLLGDSFLQADEVAFEQTIGQQLERMWGDSQRVIQHGNPSWSPLLELNWLLRQGPSLALDRVVVFLHYNDFFPGRWVGDEGYTPFARFDEAGNPRGFVFDPDVSAQKRSAYGRFIESWQQWAIWQRYYAWQKRRGLLQRIPRTAVDHLLRMPPEAFDQAQSVSSFDQQLQEAKLWGLLATSRDTAIWDADTRQRLALSERYLARMADWLAARDIDFYLVLIPFPWQLAAATSPQKAYYGWEGIRLPRGGLADHLRHFAQLRDIPFLELYPTFAAAPKPADDPLYFPQDGHWTERGHRLAAETLYPFLSIPPPTPPQDE